jgi:hypothetical protein
MLQKMVVAAEQFTGVRIESVSRRDSPPSQVRHMPRSRV